MEEGNTTDVSGGIGVGGGTSASLLIVTMEDRVVDVVDELNDQKVVKASNSHSLMGETVIDNIFKDLDLRAFRVKAQVRDKVNRFYRLGRPKW